MAKIYSAIPQGYNEFDSLVTGLFNGKEPDKIETESDGYVYLTFGNVVVKLDYVYVADEKFEGNVYAVLSQEGEP